MLTTIGKLLIYCFIFMASSFKDVKSYVTDLEDLCDEYLEKKAPSIPENIKDAIVKFGPWISILLVIKLAMNILDFMGWGSYFRAIGLFGGLNFGFIYTVSTIIDGITLVLMIIAIPKLLKQMKSGWNLMFYVALFQGINSAVLFNIWGLVMGLIGMLLSLYILFQVKSRYS